MKLKFLVIALLIAGVGFGVYGAKDPVLMKINNKEIKLSEFEYLYKKNLQQQVNKESIDDYVDRFVNYKLKVAEAESMGFDTLPRIKSELEGYQNDILEPFLVDADLREKLVQEQYDRMTKNVNVSHLMLAHGKNKAEEALQMAKMDSLRNCIINGEDFGELVMKYSIDNSKKNNHGEYGFITSGVFPYAFEYAAFNTPVGQVSQPISTDYGIHIVRVNDVKPDDGQVEVAHILRLFPRGEVTDSAKQAVKVSIDSIYNCLLHGQDFEALAKKFSQDPGSARNGGKLPLFGRGRMVKEFENAAFDLADGEISAPIETRYGYHIIKKYSHKSVGDLEEMRPTIENMIKNDERSRMPIDSRTNQVMKQLNYKKNDKLNSYLMTELKKHGGYDSTFVTDVVAKSKIPMFTYGKNLSEPLSSMVKYLNTKSKYANDEIAAAEIEGNVDRIARSTIMKHYADNLIDLNDDYRNLLNEYRDGTLLFEAMNQEVWNKAKKDDAGLEACFNANRDKYKWDQPHFKGIMVCAKNDSILKAALAAASQWKNEPVDSITSKLNIKFGRNIKMLRVVSKQGDDAMVDHIAFGGPETESTYNGYPVYSKLVGRIIAQPEDLSDVRGMVSSDYQDILEQQWLDGLHKKYKVNIDKKVLDQVRKKYSTAR